MFLCRQVADIRKIFDNLAFLVGQQFPDVELSGSLFIFMNRRQTQLKALYWDEDELHALLPQN